MALMDLWSWLGTVLAMAGILRGVLPAEYREILTGWLEKWMAVISPYAFFVIPEFDGTNPSDLYEAARMYLSTMAAQGAMVSTLTKPRNCKDIIFSLGNEQRLVDNFNGVKVEWVHKVHERRNQTVANDAADEKRSFKLRVHRGEKQKVLAGYFDHVIDRALEINRQSRDLQLYTNARKRGKYWEAVPFLHPATFDSLALEPDLKARIVQDLDEFAGGEEFYRRVGKAWKRGYLLYGPPGTGKSSMIAAIANRLRYDVYDLELTEVESNADLRKILLQTSNKSIIVIEDIDCSLELAGQRPEGNAKPRRRRESDEVDYSSNRANTNTGTVEANRVTLSGLLNFTDGLWSSCGSERLFIFTTNFVQSLDMALLRAGRMDMHISLGYCTFAAFKVLVKNFLKIDDHWLFAEAEREIYRSPMTPAEISEILVQGRSDPEAALESVIQAMRVRRANAPAEEGGVAALENGDDEKVRAGALFERSDWDRLSDSLRPKKEEAVREPTARSSDEIEIVDL